MAIVNAASMSYADVNSACTGATAGDTVMLPVGSEDWGASVLTINKSLYIIGAGVASSIIASSNNYPIQISPGADVPVRFSGVRINGGGILFNGDFNNAYCLSQVRVDHCYLFETSYNSVNIYGWVESLLDHCTIHNWNNSYCGIFIMGQNGDNYAWGRYFVSGKETPGNEHSMFIEDNIFLVDASAPDGMNEAIYHQDGGRTVTRYNLFDYSDYTDDACVFDTHGNAGGYYGVYGSYRGQPLLEIYNNTFTYQLSYRVMNLRGGSILIHDNTFVCTGESHEFGVTDEEGWLIAHFNPLRTAWPAQDQIMNCFFWNNTINASAITTLTVNDGMTEFCQENRDFFFHAPASSGGYEYYTDRPGASDTAPTDEDGDGTMEFVAVGANAYYPYSPYQYPHPLQGGTAASPWVMIYG